MSQSLASGGQSSGASVLPVNIQGLISFRTDWVISLQSKGLSRVFSSTTVQKHPFFGVSYIILVPADGKGNWSAGKGAISVGLGSCKTS